jgi:hypothetical protein
VKPPTREKIGPFTYTLEAMTEDVRNASNAVGACMADILKIVFADNIHPGQIKDTIVHESLHAIWKQTYLSKKYPDDDPDSEGEQIINELSPRILALILDNPKLVTYLQEA